MTMSEHENKAKFDYGVIVASDSRSAGINEDKSLVCFQEAMPENYKLTYSRIVPDRVEAIQEAIKDLVDGEKLPLLFTTGGTGFSPRDVTPEATLPLLDRQTPGLSEAIRRVSREKTPMWMLSRAVSGIRSGCLIINLPGSPKAIKESIEAILPALGHGLEILTGSFTQHE